MEPSSSFEGSHRGGFGLEQVHDTDPSCLQHFSDADTVKHLCTLAHKAEEAHVRKNAGIALARLAKHPDMIERMRECHGFEIIHTYVKP